MHLNRLLQCSIYVLVIDVAVIQERHQLRLQRLARQAERAEAVCVAMQERLTKGEDPAEVKDVSAAWERAERVLRMQVTLEAKLEHEAVVWDRAANQTARDAASARVSARSRQVWDRARRLEWPSIGRDDLYEAIEEIEDADLFDEIDLVLLRLCHENDIEPPKELAEAAAKLREAEASPAVQATHEVSAPAPTPANDPPEPERSAIWRQQESMLERQRAERERDDSS